MYLWLFCRFIMISWVVAFLFGFQVFASSVYGHLAKRGSSGYSSYRNQPKSRQNASVYNLKNGSGIKQMPNTASIQESELYRKPLDKESYSSQYESRKMVTVPVPSGYYENTPQQNPYVGMERWSSGPQNGFEGGQEMRRQSSLKFNRYYNFGFAQPITSQYKYSSSDGASRSVTQKSFLPIVDTNGMISMTVGTRFRFLPNLKRELGVQWELLSFRENLPSNPKSKVFHHNINFAAKLLYDIPITQTAYFSFGGEATYGFINHTVADDEYLTMGTSYAILGGIVKRISSQKDVYIMVRQGKMQQKNYKVINVSRNADISSTSIMIGIHILSR